MRITRLKHTETTISKLLHKKTNMTNQKDIKFHSYYDLCHTQPDFTIGVTPYLISQLANKPTKQKM